MRGKKKSAKSTKSESDGESPSEKRGIWHGAISFGLVNIGVKVVSAREKKDLHFSMLDPSNLSPVGYKYYNKVTGEEISRGKTVKAYEIKSGSYVIMTDADFKKANPKATQSIDIENFVSLSEIDPVFFERAYYLRPTKGSEKAYRLLNEALHKKGKVAIAKMVLHTKQHLVALIPRGKHLLLELLHFAEEVLELQELGDWQANSQKNAPRTLAKEVEMAERLIEDMTSVWKPAAYKDTYRNDIIKQAKAKAKAGKATEISEPESETDLTEASSKVLDLMPLLRKSLADKKSRNGSKAASASSSRN